MLLCDFCNVHIPGQHTRCPLCQSKLIGKPDDSENPYPRLARSSKELSRVLLIWISFASVSAAAICFAINTVVLADQWWSLFALIGIACFWIDFAILMKKKDNLPSMIIWQVVVVSIFALGWDIFTGYRGWAVDFVFPGLSVAAMIAFILLSIIEKTDIQEYIMYIVSACLFGITSFVLSLVGIVQIRIPSVASFGAAIVFLAFLTFFKGKALRSELRRRFHL